MFTQDLSRMSQQPYSLEIAKIVDDIMFVFQQECRQLANQGYRSICTTAKWRDGYHREIDFGFYRFECKYIRYVQDSMTESVFLRTQEMIRTKLREAGFKDFTVEGITEGPTYPSVFIFNRSTFLKDRSKPRYKKTIKITAYW